MTLTTQSPSRIDILFAMRGDLETLRGKREKLISACYKADRKGDRAKLAVLNPARRELIAAVDTLQAELSRHEAEGGTK